MGRHCSWAFTWTGWVSVSRGLQLVSGSKRCPFSLRLRVQGHCQSPRTWVTLPLTPGVLDTVLKGRPRGTLRILHLQLLRIWPGRHRCSSRLWGPQPARVQHPGASA